jgi:predicted Zn-dependent peptidase
MGFRREELAPGIELFTMRDTSFKTATVKTYFITDLGPDATKIALLPYVLRRGTESYPTLLDLSRSLERLFGTHLSVDVGKLVEWHTISFSLNVVAERFVPGGQSLLEPAARVLGELVNSPVLKGGVFLPDYLDQEKRSLQNHIESLINEKSQYAVEQLFRAMCKNEAYSVYEYGKVEDLPRINPRTEFSFYRRFIQKNPIKVFAFGQIRAGDVKRLLLKHVLPGDNGTRKIRKAPKNVLPKRRRSITEKMPLSLGHLVLGFRTGYRFGGPDQHAYSIYGTMLGGHMLSRLFMILREQESLAYSVHASSSLKGIMLVYAGVHSKNRRRAQEIILREMKNIAKGDFTKDEFDNAVRHLRSSFRSIRDVPNRRIAAAFVQSMTRRPRSEREVLREFDSVTPDDIVRVAGTIKPDTFYYLGS